MRRALSFAVCAACLTSLSGAASARPKSGAAVAALAAPLAEASRPAVTTVEVSVLHGTHDEREPDPRVADIPELREGPFAKYAHYDLLSRARFALGRGDKRTLRLPNGRRLETRLEDILADGSSRLVASINRPEAKDFLPLLEVKAKPGQAFIVAGQSYKRGILVLLIKVVS